MPRKKLTAVFVDKVQPPTDKDREDHFDTVLPSFGLRVGQRRKTYFVMTRALRAGKWTLTRVTLGHANEIDLPTARAQARVAIKRAEQGEDPTEVKQERRAAQETESRNSFSAVREEFLTKYRTRQRRRPGERTLTEWRRVLESDLFAAWGDTPLSKITRRDVMDATDILMARGHETAANRYLGYLRQMMRWAVDRDIIQTDPTARVKKPGAEEPRARVLTMEEIRAIWHATEPTQANKADLFGPIVRLLILTGQRRNEVAGMRWSEIAGDTWTLPSERSKNRLEHLIPLSAPAITILEERREEQTAMGMQSSLTFTSTGKTSFCGWSRSKARLDRRADIAPWALHDIRRSFITHAAEDLRVPPHILESIANHVSGARSGVAGIYNRALYLDERRAALDAWAAYLLRTVGEVEADNIVEFSR